MSTLRRESALPARGRPLPREPKLLVLLVTTLVLLGVGSVLAEQETVIVPGPTVDLDAATRSFPDAPQDASRGAFFLVTVTQRPLPQLVVDAQEHWGAPETPGEVSPTEMEVSKERAWGAAQRVVHQYASRSFPARLHPHPGQPRSLHGRIPVVDTQDISGPSGGLALALEMTDGLTPGTLTSQPVAASGRITSHGTVGGVGHIRLKIISAHRDGATLFLVPARNLSAAQSVAPPDMEVKAVSSLSEAVDLLCARGASDELCQKDHARE